MKMDIGDIFRKITRPIVTIIFACIIAQVVTQGINAPDWFLVIANMIIVWWFGDRTAQHFREKK
jgi:hypothetical protein